MVAAELIEILKNLDPNCPIMMCHYETDWEYGIERTYNFEAEGVKVFKNGAYLQIPFDYKERMPRMEEHEYQEYY